MVGNRKIYYFEEIASIDLDGILLNRPETITNPLYYQCTTCFFEVPNMAAVRRFSPTPVGGATPFTAELMETEGQSHWVHL